jgi:hypothetical protein
VLVFRKAAAAPFKSMAGTLSIAQLRGVAADTKVNRIAKGLGLPTQVIVGADQQEYGRLWIVEE